MARSSPFELLLPTLLQGGALLVADENLGDANFTALPKTTVAVSNRLEVARAAQQAGLVGHFNDFDFQVLAAGSMRRICYRIAKEKPVAHHVINQARTLLMDGGELLLVGGQQEGIRSYADKAAAYFGSIPAVRKHGLWYVARMVKATCSAPAPLDDSDYAALRPIARSGHKYIYSKPGLFGWDKIDRGSTLLAETLTDLTSAARAPWQPANLLDLGCGYGYLALVAAEHGVPHVTATDNCAAALLACRRNFAEFAVNAEIVAADCADSIAQRFEAIVCNPPFHRGFAGDLGLTTRFVAAAARLLAPTGRALFVVQRGIPLEKLAAQCSLQAEPIRDDAGFQVFLLSSDAQRLQRRKRQQRA